MNTDIRISDIIDPSWLPFQVRGRSMDPTLPDKTILWYDPNDKQLVEGELYVLDMGMGAMLYPEVRRMTWPEYDKLVMTCDNPSKEFDCCRYREIKSDQNSFSLLGRVKLSITLHDPLARRSLSRKPQQDPERMKLAA